MTPALGELAGGVGGMLPLRIGGETVDVRVATVVERIPGTTGDAIVADAGALRTAVDTRAPGAAPVGELWLDVEDGEEGRVEAALSRRPFAVLEKRSRAELEADARRDPLGHGTLLALGAAALAALVLAVWGLVLAIRADLRDDRGELVDLEAQGATPTLLRRVVAARATLAAARGRARRGGGRDPPRVPRHPGRLGHRPRDGARASARDHCRSARARRRGPRVRGIRGGARGAHHEARVLRATWPRQDRR